MGHFGTLTCLGYLGITVVREAKKNKGSQSVVIDEKRFGPGEDEDKHSKTKFPTLQLIHFR